MQFQDIKKTSKDNKQNRELLTRFQNEMFESLEAYAFNGGNPSLAIHALMAAALHLGLVTCHKNPLGVIVHLLNCASVELGNLKKVTDPSAATNAISLKK